MKKLSKFGAKSISGSGDIDRGHKKPPPPDLQGPKKPMLNRVNAYTTYTCIPPCTKTTTLHYFNNKCFLLKNLFFLVHFLVQYKLIIKGYFPLT